MTKKTYKKDLWERFMKNSMIKPFYLNLYKFLGILLLCLVSYQCDDGNQEEASLRVLHHIQDSANLEILIDKELILEVQPGEMSRSAQIAVSKNEGQQLTIRNSGNLEVLLKQKLNPMNKRENILILEGNSDNIMLTEVSQNIPLDTNQHNLEVIVINLSSANYDLPNFSLIHEDLPDPIRSNDITKGVMSKNTDVFLMSVPANNSVQFTIETAESSSDVFYNTDAEIYEDLLPNESSLIIITFTQENDNNATFDLTWLRTSIL
jgi:hypothetical protein